MDIPDKSPINAKHPDVKEQFDQWWVFLNGMGSFSFLLFLASLGTGDDKYFSALFSSLLVAWGLWLGRNKFPRIIVRLRGSEFDGAKALEKTIMKEQMPFFRVPFTHFPYWLGMFSLMALVIQPAISPQDFLLYLPSFIR